MKAKLIVTAVVTLATVVGGGRVMGGAGPAGAAAVGQWKGAETMTPLALAPNPARCGMPPVVEARFAGSGIDTSGGTFAVTASGCIDLDNLHVFDLEATDTFTRTGEQVRIAPDDFQLVLDPETCVATNSDPVPFHVAGGTGRYEGATGGGVFDFALSHPACSGTPQPAHIWFTGTITLA